MKNKIKIIFLFIILAGIGLSSYIFIQKKLASHDEHLSNTIYYCPMHPSYTSPEPGECPICHMKLVKKQEELPTSKSNQDICFQHNCPMVHDGKPCPMLVVGTAGEDIVCPVCKTHMSEKATEPSTQPNEYAKILISPQKAQLIGIKTTLIQKQKVEKRIRTVGKVMVDETKIVHVHPKVEGWIEEIFAQYEGDKVIQGQPLFSFYSPDFVTAQKEYLIAFKALQSLSNNANAEIQAQSQSNLESSRQRLLWWDINKEQIDNLEKTQTPSKNLILTSPINGVVLTKHIYKGEFMERGADFFDLADLSTIWIEAEIYEHDLPFISVGESASVTLPYVKDRVLTGKVIFVAPVLKAETRTMTARIELPNTEYVLKPEAYVNVEILADLGERLVIPTEAIMDTGERKIIFISKGDGIFEPREIKTGANNDEWTEITAGAQPGEMAVNRGNFLVDSESRLKAAIEGMGGGHQHE